MKKKYSQFYHVVQMVVTKEEHLCIMSLAQRAGMNVSKWMRSYIEADVLREMAIAKKRLCLQLITERYERDNIVGDPAEFLESELQCLPIDFITKKELDAADALE